MLVKRARAKLLSAPLGAALAEQRRALRLADTAAALAAAPEGDAYRVASSAVPSRMELSYRNTWYCAGELRQENRQGVQTLAGRFCGNRWCLVCNRLRTARAINRYLPVVEGWDDPWMVTLTAPNVEGAQLAAELARYLDDFTAIKRAINRTHRGKLVALRKLECTFNPRRAEAGEAAFHPHFHVVVNGIMAAALLVELWLEQRPDATAAAQDMVPAERGAMREIFKYFTKLVTKARTADRVTTAVAPLPALDTIFTAMRGRRVYQTVGFKLPKATDATDPDAAALDLDGVTLVPDELVRGRDGQLRRDRPGYPGAVWQWSQAAADWVLPDTGESLAGYTPSPAMRGLVGSVEAQSPSEPPPPPQGASLGPCWSLDTGDARADAEGDPRPLLDSDNEPGPAGPAPPPLLPPSPP